jgi:hypothetical protein
MGSRPKKAASHANIARKLLRISTVREKTVSQAKGDVLDVWGGSDVSGEPQDGK